MSNFIKYTHIEEILLEYQYSTREKIKSSNILRHVIISKTSSKHSNIVCAQEATISLENYKTVNAIFFVC